ncbi:BnaC07g15240D [Brassica napus]|uniref:BnaC07g15240D protein n=1 Tax=Brassica napus TaxID=3708 RepID=A0A078H386_BRANA|nr:BnaC07g15240D [Brassica napus]
MGEVAETVTRKKKGRPSLLDLQKRAIKQQQLQKLHDDHRSAPKNPNSLNSGSRSKRRNPNRNRVSSDDDGEEEDDDERREKKHRLLRGLNTHSRRHSPNSKSGGAAHGSGYTGEKASDILQGSPVESGPTTPLPDKKLLAFILDRLQKKDTYGVYSDPVDPEELPDYHDIIENPMDFSTLRNKLDSGAYASLEQFEGDVFLICSNAMEYNSADTVYYRQARAIQELAKKHFENLRQDSDDEEPQTQQQQQHHQHQLKVSERGRPPKKQPEPSCLDRTTSEISADDALNPGGDSSSKFSGAYNLRRTSVRINHDSETQSGCSQDWENEFPPSVVKAVNKYGLKHFDVDDNRRETYNHLSTSTQEPWVLTTLEDELKQLIPVGLNTEYGYTRSLARYGANLGPLAWKILSRRIETALPAGIKFGLGWVGEDDPPKQTLLVWSLGKQKCSNDHSDRVMSPTASVSSPLIGNRHSSSQGIKETAPARVLNRETDSNGLIRGFSGFSQSPSPMMGITRQQQPNLTNEAKPGGQQQGLLFPYNRQEFHRFPLDLNARLVSPNSPGSNQQTCSSSSQHPDLALQL